MPRLWPRRVLAIFSLQETSASTETCIKRRVSGGGHLFFQGVECIFFCRAYPIKQVLMNQELQYNFSFTCWTSLEIFSDFVSPRLTEQQETTMYPHLCEAIADGGLGFDLRQAVFLLIGNSFLPRGFKSTNDKFGGLGFWGYP